MDRNNKIKVNKKVIHNGICSHGHEGTVLVNIVQAIYSLTKANSKVLLTELSKEKFLKKSTKLS